MKRSLLSAVLLVTLLGLVWVASHRSTAVPMPTEHRLDSEAERQNRKGRKEWMRQMHRAAPGVDWEAINRSNGLLLQEKRKGRRTDLWTERGSHNLAGRMHCATLTLEGDSLYGGSSKGGVWKGSLMGQGWRPISDNLYGGSHGLAVAGSGTEVITSVTDGGLVHYSEDGGASWHLPAGLPGSIQKVKRVARDFSSSDRVYLMIVSAGNGKELFRSEDAGRSYTEIYHLNTAVGDFWIDRQQGGSIYVAKARSFYRSDDLGANWNFVGFIHTSSPGKVVLAGSEAGAPTFYAATKIGSEWTLHRSLDAGLSWEYRYDIDDFWETLAASIVNPNLVLFGGVELFRSLDGGSSFNKVNNWYDYYSNPLYRLHADLPGFDCLWTGSEELMYIATDGGLYRGINNVAVVQNISLEGLGVSQYYGTHTSVLNPWRILAGAQDQGYQRCDELNGESGSLDFTQIWSGDYGHLTSSNGSHDWVYSVYPGFLLIHVGEENPSLYDADFPANESYSWLPFILADPEDPQSVFFCAKHLHRGTWDGIMSVDWTAGSQDFTVAGGSYLTALSISPVDLSRRIVCTNTGRIWHSSDSGENWTLSSDTGPSSHYFYGTGILHSGTDPLVAWLAGSGYSGPAVYQTVDGGEHWTPLSDGLPSTLVYELALESPGEALHAATDAGPWRFDPATEIWSYAGGSEAPLTTFWSVETVPALGVIRYGTYGRGIWDYDYLDPTASEDAPDFGRFALSNFPNPFNPKTTIHFRLPEAGLMELEIYDVQGKSVRQFERIHRESGSHSLQWDGRDDQGESCASGHYLVQLRRGDRRESLKITLAR